MKNLAQVIYTCVYIPVNLGDLFPSDLHCPSKTSFLKILMCMY